MTLRDGWPAVSNAADQFDIRAALRVDTAQDVSGSVKTGVAVNAKSLSGLVTARSDMSVDVAAFAATLDRQGPVKLYNDGTVQVKLDAAPNANSRIDTVYVKQNEASSPISDSSDGPVFGKVTGVAGTSLVAPSIPAGALRLADITIPSTATSTKSSGVTITQRYPYTASAGGFLRFRTSDEMTAWSAPDGYRAVLADGSEYNRSGGVWVSQTRTRVYTGSKIINGTGTSEYTFLSKPDYTAIVGRAPAFGDVIVFTNGDRAAGTFTSTFSAIDNQNNSVNIVFPSNVSGARRINYAIIVSS
ncbi:hypothetical protein [Bifidobacterium mongoliense]|uniref:Tail fiber protein n=1 Tax=Bifidobacterium mongoliense TaxID=518643 RepID=A0A423UE01_9BIFI|nr:hypothetical protein [Bifidobacterium mongoliense]ROT86931.1 hypothetical protein BMONG18_0930 [Bifidobacterium mongoliense]